MGQYGAVDITTWNDGKFRSLTPPPPCGQVLWLYLLAPRERTIIPGLIPVGVGTISESLRWPYDATRAAMDEVVAQGMAVEDPGGPLIWLPNALRHNRPRNQHQVTGWGRAWASIPECPLKRRAWVELQQSIGQLGEQFAQAFTASFPEPSGGQFQAPSGGTVPPNSPRNRRRVGPRNRPQDSGGTHEQEHEQEQKASAAAARVSDAVAEPDAPPSVAVPESPGPASEPATSGAAQANAASGGQGPAARDAGGAAPAGIAGGPGARGPARPGPVVDDIPVRVLPVTDLASGGLGPLGAEFKSRAEERWGWGPLLWAAADKRAAVATALENLIRDEERLGGLLDLWLAEMGARGAATGRRPTSSMTGVLLDLQRLAKLLDGADPLAGMRKRCPRWARCLDEIARLPADVSGLEPGQFQRLILTLDPALTETALVLTAPSGEWQANVVRDCWWRLITEAAARFIGPGIAVSIVAQAAEAAQEA